MNALTVALASALLSSSVAIVSTVVAYRAALLPHSGKGHTACRTLLNDFWTLQDLLNHSGSQQRWPGPSEHYWQPSFEPSMM